MKQRLVRPDYPDVAGWQADQIKFVANTNRAGRAYLYDQDGRTFWFDPASGRLHEKQADNTMKLVATNLTPEQVVKRIGPVSVTTKDHQVYRDVGRVEFEEMTFKFTGAYSDPVEYRKASIRTRLGQLADQKNHVSVERSARETALKENAVKKSIARHEKKKLEWGDPQAKTQRRAARGGKDLRSSQRQVNWSSAENKRAAEARAGRRRVDKRVAESGKRFVTPESTPEKPLFTGFGDPKLDTPTLEDEGARRATNIVSDYLRKVGAAFRDAGMEDVERATRRAGGQAQTLGDKVSHFFDSITINNPLTGQDERLINLILTDGPDSLTESEQRLVSTALIYTDDHRALSRLAQMYDPSIADHLEGSDIMRARRLIIANLLGDDEFANMQRVTHQVMTSDLPTAEQAARIENAKKNLSEKLLAMPEDPASVRNMEAGAIDKQQKLHAKAGVVKTNVASVQQQVEINGNIIGFDNIGRVSIDDLIEDASISDPSRRRYPTNMLGYTLDELKAMRRNGTQFIGLDMQGGEEVELRVMQGFGQDGKGQKLLAVYTADEDQIRSFLADDADRAAFIDSENTYGVKVYDFEIDDLDDIVKGRGDAEYSAMLKKVLSEVRDDSSLAGLSPSKRQQIIMEKTAARIADEVDGRMSRLRSISLVAATRERRHNISDPNMSRYVYSEGDMVLPSRSGTFHISVDTATKRYTSIDLKGIEKLRATGSIDDLMEIGEGYTHYIAALRQMTEEGYRVEGLNILKADLPWFREEAYLTAADLLKKGKGNAEAEKLARALLDYSGMRDLDDAGQMLGWSERIPGVRPGHEAVIAASHDVTRDIRKMLPAVFTDENTGKPVRGYNLGDGKFVKLEDLVDELPDIISDDFESMYGKSSSTRELLEQIREKEGMRRVNKVLDDGQSSLFGLIDDDENFEAVAQRLEDDYADEALDTLKDRWLQAEHDSLQDSLVHGGGASGDELYVLANRELRQAGQAGTRHESLDDAYRVGTLKDFARKVALKTRQLAVRTIEDRGSGRLDGVIDAVDEFSAEAGEAPKVMVTGPKGGAGSAYRNLSLFVEKVYRFKERVLDTDKVSMFGRQVEAFGLDIADSLKTGSFSEMARATREVANEGVDMVKVAAKAASQRKGLAAMAAVGIAAAAGTAIRRRHLADESWKYGESWTSEEERAHNARLADPTMGRLPLESSTRRSNHHNMRPDRNDHLFRG